jgi:hypothetical protein
VKVCYSLRLLFTIVAMRSGAHTKNKHFCLYLIRMLRFIALLTLTVLVACTALHAQVDSLQAASPNITINNTDQEFDVFLLFMGLMAVSIMAGMAILTVLLAGIILLFVFLLIAAGVLSVSTGVGLYKKSVTAALRTALYLVSALICSIGGAALAWIIQQLFDIPVSQTSALMTGSIAGALGGIVGALCLVGLTQIIFRKFRKPVLE